MRTLYDFREVLDYYQPDDPRAKHLSPEDRRFFAYMIGQGDDPDAALTIIQMGAYYKATGELIRTFTMIEMQLHAISVALDRVMSGELADKYEFHLSDRIAAVKKKLRKLPLKPDNLADLEADLDLVASLATIRHRVIHWSLADGAKEGEPFILRKFSMEPKLRKFDDSASYTLIEIETALAETKKLSVRVAAYLDVVMGVYNANQVP